MGLRARACCSHTLRVTAIRPASCRFTRAFRMPKKTSASVLVLPSAQSEITGVTDELAGRHLQFHPMGAADAEGASARWRLPALKVPDTRRGRRACSCPN